MTRRSPAVTAITLATIVAASPGVRNSWRSGVTSLPPCGLPRRRLGRIALHAMGDGLVDASPRPGILPDTEIRPARRGSHPAHRRRMRNAELHRHESAGGDAGNGGLGEIDVQRR